MQAESRVPVYFRKIARPSSAAPSAIVVVWVSAFVVIASVPEPKASAISSRFRLVFVPQVPDSSPVVISSSRRLFTNVPMFNSCCYLSTTTQVGVCVSLTSVQFGVCESSIKPHTWAPLVVATASTPVTSTETDILSYADDGIARISRRKSNRERASRHRLVCPKVEHKNRRITSGIFVENQGTSSRKRRSRP